MPHHPVSKVAIGQQKHHTRKKWRKLVMNREKTTKFSVEEIKTGEWLNDTYM